MLYLRLHQTNAPRSRTNAGTPSTELKNTTRCWLESRVMRLGCSGSLGRMEIRSLAPESHETELANRSMLVGSWLTKVLLAKSASPNTTRRVFTVLVVVSGAIVTPIETGPGRSTPGL